MDYRFLFFLTCLLFSMWSTAENAIHLKLDFQNIDQTALIEKIPRTTFTIKHQFKRPTNSFTQGLSYYKPYFYESSGGYGNSYFKRYTLQNNRKLITKTIARNHFAEGITIFDDQLFLLTWKAGKVYRYDKKTLQEINSLNFNGEGWGLSSDQHYLYMSNGSDHIQKLRPNDFSVIQHIAVKFNNKAIYKLNELEWVKGLLYANIWYQQSIVIIEPNSGKILSRLDLSAIIDRYKLDRFGVLNGIAYHPERDSLFVTGKQWPLMFELQVDDSRALTKNSMR